MSSEHAATITRRAHVTVSPDGLLVPSSPSPSPTPSTPTTTTSQIKYLMLEGNNELGEPFTTYLPESTPSQTETQTETWKQQGALQLVELNHIAFDSVDIEGSASFYVNVLGFERISRPNFPFPGAWLRLGTLMIHLFPPDPEFPSSSSTTTTSTPPPDPRALRRGRHMAFQVKSVEDTERKLRMAGTVYTKFGIPGSAAVQMFFRDPEGRGIEVGNYVPINTSKL